MNENGKKDSVIADGERGEGAPARQEASAPIDNDDAVSDLQALDADASRSAVTGRDTPSPSAAKETTLSAEQSAAALQSEAVNASSQRLRLIPPDGKPANWWTKNRDKLTLIEMILTGVFLFLALYFLYLWIFTKPDVAVHYELGREGFVQALAALPVMRTDSSWRVKAQPGRWRNIVVHHTASERGDPEGIERFHREVRKWPNGLAYHFLIGNGNGMRDGEVFPSRRWQEQLDGAHVKMRGFQNGNSFAIGVALVGNFEEKLATPRQLAALRGLLQFLLVEYGIKHEEIVGHGQVAAKFTACPGKYFYLDEVVRSL